MIHELKSKKIDFKNFIQNKQSRKVAYFIWRNPWMVAANNTFINHLLELNKFENVYADLERYPEITLESIKQRKTELILLSSEPFPFKEKHITEIKEHTNNSTPFLVDGEYFSWYGSRLLKAFDYFKELHNRV